MPRLQRVYQMLGAGRSKADEINDCIRLECCDARAECPRDVLGRPVDLDATYCSPCRMWHIRLALSTAGDDYVVARIDKSRDEERADVTGPADDDKSHYANAPRSRTRNQIALAATIAAKPSITFVIMP